MIKLNSLQNKLQALIKKFFPEPTLVDILNIGLSEYLEPFETNEKIQEKEIYEVIYHTASNKALSLD